MICSRCEERRRPSSQDPDFCQECYDEIEHARDTIMARTDALVGFGRTWGPSRQRDKTMMFGFLSVFHPEMSDRRKREIVAGMDE